MSDQQNEWNMPEEPKAGGEDLNAAASQFDTAAAAEVWDTGAPVGQPDAPRPVSTPEVIDVQPNVSGFDRPNVHTETIPPMAGVEAPKKKSPVGWIIAIVVLLLLCCCLVIGLIVAASAGVFGDILETALPLAGIGLL